MDHERLETLHPLPAYVAEETSPRTSCWSGSRSLRQVRLSLEVSEAASQLRSRRRRTQQDTVTKRVERAETLVCLGEISAARHALEGGCIWDLREFERSEGH